MAHREGSSLNMPDEAALRRLPPDGGPDFNRLVFESSPYLLQHAANPVDWYPWGEAAFEKARAEDKPLFLSIGYATCHWCHVMERETFEDAEAAAVMNRHLVCVKVDQEERPDIDDIYMTACQAMTGTGGWPLSIMLTHDLQPFFAGTYFPKRSVPGRIGMMDLVTRVHHFWTEQRAELIRDAAELTRHVGQMSAVTPGDELDEHTLAEGQRQLAYRYDRVRGGFGTAPKFPTPHHFTFLLRRWKRTGAAAALEMVPNSLAAMRRGGIFDHVGLGFHRYATDRDWLLPHFEKMLYDQALLAMAYLEAGQAAQDPSLHRAARDIFGYVLRDMTAPEGGFFSAEDADSEGVEGKFYLWTPVEVRSLLGEQEGELFCRVYQIREEGNFREEHNGRLSGENIPHLITPLTETAAEMGLSAGELEMRLEKARQTLFAVREARIHPLKDDKILTDWNGLMIAALAMGARILGEPAYAAAARKAMAFVRDKLRLADGRLLKRYRAGNAGLPAHLDDYAFIIWGLLELYRATGERPFLAEALQLTELTWDLFGNEQTGGHFLTARDGEALILRSQKIYDGALPSGNSVMACNLVALAHLTGHTALEARARATMTAFSGQVGPQPSMSTQLLNALDTLVGPAHQVVLVGRRGAEDLEAMRTALDGVFLPNLVVLVKEEDDPELSELAPFTREHRSLDGRATAYVCSGFSCRQPTTSVSEMMALLT